MDVEPVVEARARLGEGPVWDDRCERLYWVDITGRAVHRFDPVTGVDEVQEVAGQVGVAVPVRDGDGVLAAVDRRVVVLSGAFGGAAGTGRPVESGGRTRWPLNSVEESLVATLPTGERANDGACDPAGRFLVGTLHAGRESACGLYRVDGPGVVTELVGGVHLSNGLDWSPDGSTLYYADTPTHRVDAFDYDVSTGTLGRRRTFVDLADGPWRPDGLTVDADGGVWVVIARRGEVRHYLPDGKLQQIVTVPAHRVTSCAFGGRNLDELYITSGLFDMTEEELSAEPLAGALFRVRPGVRGRPSPAWIDIR